jgi:hypothetical protein
VDHYEESDDAVTVMLSAGRRLVRICSAAPTACTSAFVHDWHQAATRHNTAGSATG